MRIVFLFNSVWPGYKLSDHHGKVFPSKFPSNISRTITCHSLTEAISVTSSIYCTVVSFLKAGRWCNISSWVLWSMWLKWSVIFLLLLAMERRTYIITVIHTAYASSARRWNGYRLFKSFTLKLHYFVMLKARVSCYITKHDFYSLCDIKWGLDLRHCVEFSKKNVVITRT